LATRGRPAYPPRVPIYIVRWANRSASIVRARDEDHLLLLLDEVGDPGAALWEEYDGPLWVELQPKYSEVEPGKFELAADHFDARTDESDVLELGIAAGDTSSMMMQSIVAHLFPNLYTTLRELAVGGLPNEQARARIVDALERERWFEHALSERHRPSDPAELALYVRVLEGELTVKRDLAAELEENAALQREEDRWREAQYARLHAEREQALDELASDLDDGDFAEAEFDDDELEGDSLVD
jgi:hypothetical protein